MSLAAGLIRNEVKPRRPKSSWAQRLEIAEHVHFLKRFLGYGQTPKPLRKEIIGLTAEKYGVKPSFVYEVLREFDDDVLAQIRRMPKDENELGLIREPDQQLREILKDASRDTLVEIIDDLLARE
jgi:hypothetical protein